MQRISVLFPNLLHPREAFYKLILYNVSRKKKIQWIEVPGSCRPMYWAISTHSASRKLLVQILRHYFGVVWSSTILLKNNLVFSNNGIFSSKKSSKFSVNNSKYVGPVKTLEEIGSNISVSIIPTQTFIFQRTWKFLVQVTLGFSLLHKYILCELNIPSHVNNDSTLNITRDGNVESRSTFLKKFSQNILLRG